MKLPLYTVDAFTQVPFTGNSAAICLPGTRKIPEQVMQNLATEMNISETAYLELVHSKDDYKLASRFKLRWFTPTNEVALCGHATLASAAVLFFQCENSNNEITFETLSGDLKARREKEKIILDFPSNPPENFETDDTWNNVIKAIVGENHLKWVDNVSISMTVQKIVIKLHDTCTESDLKSIAPDFEAMMKSHDGSTVKGIIVTVKAQKTYDFLSRYFAPWNGINEDPVTGSAHTVLAPFWGNILQKKILSARQCSSRGGDVEVRIREDDRIELVGFATMVVVGYANIPQC